VVGPTVLVALANAGRPRRPPGARRAISEDPFEQAQSATILLGGYLERPVVAGELSAVRDLAREVGRIAEDLVDGRDPLLDELNRFAAGSVGRAEVGLNAVGALEARVRWEAGSAASVLARHVVEELGAIEPERLRRCARPECGLIFYDSTRPGTQRWHSEVPCGWRERQRRRRARARRSTSSKEE
jgi:predicted RNA-binding Zn ribbon-like protein